MFDDRLKKLREKRGLTLTKVAADLNIPKTTYSNYERDLREPTAMTILKIATYFDVSPDFLFGFTPANKKSSPPELDDERESIVKLLRTLKDSELEELENFVDYLLYKRGR